MMSEMPYQPSKAIKEYCKNISRKRDNDYERYLSESWFSNTLAWLLNPKESHGLGVRFANEFVKAIARKRSEGFMYCKCRENGEEPVPYDYAHKASMKRLMDVLAWLQSCCNEREKIPKDEVKKLRQGLREVAAAYLQEELERTSGNKTGSWEILKKDVRVKNRIYHTSHSFSAFRFAVSLFRSVSHPSLNLPLRVWSM